ncbi:hypothetical protein B0H16DRAFT_1479408 [Mycena metata]|uniref:Uncharacterized protein n=1 Tax=Mycena metata TaxID=1033252 RepID=A0AAD7MEC8_9AGAR|nr:hypothetical protein B0H16DRAFT_1479408 [Mycena metata]
MPDAVERPRAPIRRYVRGIWRGHYESVRDANHSIVEQPDVWLHRTARGMGKECGNIQAVVAAAVDIECRRRKRTGAALQRRPSAVASEVYHAFEHHPGDDSRRTALQKSQMEEIKVYGLMDFAASERSALLPTTLFTAHVLLNAILSRRGRRRAIASNTSNGIALNAPEERLGLRKSVTVSWFSAYVTKYLQVGLFGSRFDMAGNPLEIFEGGQTEAKEFNV